VRTTAFNYGKKTKNMAEYKQCSYSSTRQSNYPNVSIETKGSHNSMAQTRDVCGRVYRQLQTTKRKIIHVTDTDVLLPDKLNTFFACFEDNTVPPVRPAMKDCGHSFYASKTFKHVKTCKVAGPDGIPSCVLRACADQLAGVFMDIFILSLLQFAFPTCFKMATIVPVPKKAKVTELNDSPRSTALRD
jgi:hypothetical protein